MAGRAVGRALSGVVFQAFVEKTQWTGVSIIRARRDGDGIPAQPDNSIAIRISTSAASYHNLPIAARNYTSASDLHTTF